MLSRVTAAGSTIVVQPVMVLCAASFCQLLYHLYHPMKKMQNIYLDANNDQITHLARHR